VIASSTDTHADLVEAAARTGKAVFCEKPLDLDRRAEAEHERRCLQKMQRIAPRWPVRLPFRLSAGVRFRKKSHATTSNALASATGIR
jgi:hypothetical protein